MKSLDAYDRPVTLKDSQYFLLPVVSLKAGEDRASGVFHTLSQLFLEIQNKKLSPYTIHLQVYTYNDLMGKILRQKLWFIPGLRDLLIKPLQDRLLLIQGYLHSAHSGTMSLRLMRDPKTGKDRLVLTGEPAEGAGRIIHQVVRQLNPSFRKLGLFPILAGLEITPPGRGFHSGGSFPMRKKPAALETDILGRLPGASRTHIVDASVFPSIPATTITLTTMANAHRIGSA